MRWTHSILGLPDETGFIAGRAPVHWREELRRETAQLDELRIACDWIGSWGAAGEMLLCRSSLLGSTLEEITQSKNQETEAPEQARSKSSWKGKDIRSNFLPTISKNLERHVDLPSDPHLWSSQAGLRIDKSPSGEGLAPRFNLQKRNAFREVVAIDSWKETLASREQEALTSEMMNSPLQMDKRASRELLSHFSGGADLADDLNQIQPRSHKISGPDNRVLPSVSWDAETQRIWLQDMANRAFSSLLKKDPGAFSAPLQAITSWPLFSEDGPLADQWTTPFNGRKAPMDLLAYKASSLEKKPIEIHQGQKPRSSSGRAVETGSEDQFVPKIPEVSPFSLLADQSAVPLRGQTAPMDLLANLAGHLIENHGQFSQGQRFDSISHAAGSKDADKRSMLKAQGSRSDEAERKSPSIPAKLHENERQISIRELSGQSGWPFGEALQNMQQASYKFFEGDGQICHILNADGKMPASSLIAPPRAALSLPDLLPPQRTEMPSLPVASASARLGAKLEAEAEMSDDLNILAAKVKRILDEQARRHGIDV